MSVGPQRSPPRRNAMYFRHSFITIPVLMIVLVLIAASAAAPQVHTNAVDLPANVEGRYKILGINPNGDRYTGTLEVIAHGDVFEFLWNAGRKYSGIGVRNGKIVAVAFANGAEGSGCGVIDS